MNNLKSVAGMRKAAKHINQQVFNNSIDLSGVIFKPINLIEMSGLNHIHFDGKVDFFGVTLGMEVGDNEIFVCVINTLTDQKFLDILTHELIHVWQMQHDKSDIHGKSFKKWCEIAYNVLYMGMDSEAA